jgi:nicotinate-nucleotide adenylyltransferase
MTLLEKILYIADYMEPHRDFEGVEELRCLAYEDVDKAVLRGCEMSIEDMAQRGYAVHENTQHACDWLKGNFNGPGRKENE